MRSLQFAKTGLLTGLSALMIAATLTTGAFGQTNDTTVVNSGDNGQVDSEVEVDTNVTVRNTNDATITQNVDARSNTGNNNVSRNIGHTSLETGDAVVATDLSAKVNGNWTAVSGLGAGSAQNTTDIVNTGDNLDVESEVDIETDVDVTNRNDADVRQTADLRANSGRNDVRRNIGHTDVSTGDAVIAAAFDVDANTNVTWVDLGSGNGDGLVNDLLLTNTGDDVEVDAEVESETDIDVTNRNDADIRQRLDARANSGDNDVARNIGEVEFESGDATVLAAVAAQANGNWAFVGGGHDSSMAENMTDIVNTGDDLDVESEVDVEYDADVTNTNTLTANQTVFSVSRTGDNDIRRNIGQVLAASGMAGVAEMLEVSGNTNVTVLGGDVDGCFEFPSCQD